MTRIKHDELIPVGISVVPDQSGDELVFKVSSATFPKQYSVRIDEVGELHCDCRAARCYMHCWHVTAARAALEAAARQKKRQQERARWVQKGLVKV